MKKVILLLIFSLLVCGCSQDERVTKLGEELRRMDSDTDTGINLQTYGDRLRELSFALKEVVDNELGSELFRAEAKSAVEDYKYAGSTWALKLTFIDENFTYRKPRYAEKDDKLWLPPDPDFSDDGDEILEANLLIVVSGEGDDQARPVSLDQVLQSFWKQAGEHSEKALKEIK